VEEDEEKSGYIANNNGGTLKGTK
jgi:hypothetical protein